MRVRLPLVLIAAALWAAPAALANSTTSANWAGYAIHHAHTKFGKIVGVWKQPALTCTAGTRSYSAYWVGLGGYSANSKALEQIGTEADCDRAGVEKMSAWYELVPAPSKPLKLTVHAGDSLEARVIVTGHHVTLTLKNLTTHKTASKTVRTSTLDLTSAEWIAEAPSECVSSNDCRSLPLADFGSTDFSSAYARTTTGHRGSISNRAWSSTRITLVASGTRFAGFGSGGGDGEATPSVLSAAGSEFTVTYSAVTGNPGSPQPTDVRSAEVAR